MARATLAGARLKRSSQRLKRMNDRLAAAVTAEARLCSAFDWLRGSARQLATRGTSRTGLSPNRPAAHRIMREAADYLAALAAEIDEGTHDHAE